jgi:hypothetical protein
MPQKKKEAYYSNYTIERSRKLVSGLYPMPVAGPNNQPVSFVRLHADYFVNLVIVDATRVGAPPEIPSPYDVNPNEVLIGARQGATEAQLAGGVKAYGVVAVYSYVPVNSPGLTADLPLGRLPYENTAASDSYIPAAAFKKGLLHQGPAAGFRPLPPMPDPIQVRPS